VRNREAAKIMIGDKLPVVTSNVTSNGVVSPSVSYLDVGLKLEVQPDIRLKSNIGIKVDLEVSSITKTFILAGGTQTYQIGTRNASTRLNLRDGETQILGGLINEQEGTSANRIPGIGDLPTLNRIFGSQSDSKDRKELVLSITPHLIRNLVLPAAGQTQFWSGTESSLKMSSLGESLNQNGAKTSETSMVDGSNNGPQKSLAMPLESAKNLSLFWKSAGTVKDGVMELSLNVKADGTMRSLPMQIGFDPLACQILSVDESNYFKRDGANTTFSSSVDAKNGRIYVTAARNDVQGAPAGEFSVLSIKLRPLGTSSTAIRVLSAEPVVASGERVTVIVPPPWAVATTAVAQ
jgi:general secretion pathway protein D